MQIMKFEGKFYFFLLLTLLLHLLVFYMKNFVPATKAVDGVEQENFLQYAYYLKLGVIPERIGLFFTRLFPGVPFLVYLISFISVNPISIAVIFVILFISILFFLVYLLTEDAFFSLWVTVFPPVVFELTSKISTETITIIMMLLIYLLYFRYKQILVAFLLTGYTFLIRPVGVMFIIPLILDRYREQKRIDRLIEPFLLFLSIPVMLIFYNLYLFDRPLHQFYAYNNTIGSTFIIPFLLQNWSDWYVQGLYQTLASFVIYTITAFFLLWLIVKQKSDFLFDGDNNFIKLWVVLTLLFILGIGPKEFIAAGGRFYSVLYTPAFVFLYNKLKDRKLILYLLLPSMIFAFI